MTEEVRSGRAKWLFLGVLLLSLAIGLGRDLYSDLAGSFSHQWQERLQAAAGKRVTAIEIYLESQKENATVVARYPTLQHVLGIVDSKAPLPFPRGEEPLSHLGELLDRVIEQGDFERIWVLDKEGRTILARGEDGPEISPERLGALKSGYDFLVIDDDSFVTLKVSVSEGVESKGWLILALPGSAFKKFAAMEKDEPWIKVSLIANPGAQDETVLQGFDSDQLSDGEYLSTTVKASSLPLQVLARVSRQQVKTKQTYLLLALTLLFVSVAGASVLLGYGYWREERLHHRITKLKGEARMSKLMNRAPDPIFLFDPEEKLLYANGRVSSVLGYQIEELEGRSFRELHSEGRTLESLFQDEDSLIITTLKRSDGSECPVEMHCQRLQDSRGAVMVVARDMTERRELEALVKNAERMLAEGQKMEAVGRLAGGVAHDFNNLLTMIAGYAELLTQEEGSRDSLAEEMQAAIERAKSLTTQLLTFSTNHSGSATFFDFGPLFRQSVSLVSRLYPKNLDFSWSCEEEAFPVHLNRADGENMLFSLLTNAGDATEEKGSVQASLRRCQLEEQLKWAGGTLEPGQYVEIVVTDTGTGMSEEVKSKAFEPFFTTKPAGRGTGMGLATAFGIVQKAGGGIELESEVGEGSCFRIYLPLVEDPQPRSREPVGPTAGEKKGRVLLVEDEEGVRRLLDRALRKAGFQVESAADGREAVEKFSEVASDFDILLTDIVMPELRGTEVAKIIRAKNPEIRIVYMSGYTDGTLGLEPDSLFLQKPFSPAELIAKLRSMQKK